MTNNTKKKKTYHAPFILNWLRTGCCCATAAAFALAVLARLLLYVACDSLVTLAVATAASAEYVPAHKHDLMRREKALEFVFTGMRE